MELTHFESLYPGQTRADEIARIFSCIKDGNSCQLLAIPGIGRSTVLGLLAYNRTVRIHHVGEEAQTKYHFVLINLSEVRKRPLFDVTKLIFLSLVDSLRDRGLTDAYEKALQIFKDHLALQDELVLTQGLKQTIDLLTIEYGLTITLLFDRFEEYIPMLTPEFFANLRVMRNRAKYQFSVVFSLTRPLESVVEPTIFAEFYEFFADHTIYVRLYDEIGLNFRLSHLETLKGKTLSEAQRKEIITITGGHGKLAKRCAEYLLEHTATGKTLTTNLLEQHGIQATLYELWHALQPQEQQALLTMNTTTLPEYLTTIGLVKDNTITIPLFTQYLPQLQKHTAQEHTTTFVLDTMTNEIKKGDVVLSELLTSSEFRLLRFFLENTDRVLEREEIIQGVWKDTATTMGVTDQALDQLIFRVRKKIEQDPNNPYHIQTVKGRGFRFLG